MIALTRGTSTALGRPEATTYSPGVRPAVPVEHCKDKSYKRD